MSAFAYSSKIGPLVAKREYLRNYRIMQGDRCIGRIFGDGTKQWCAGFASDKVSYFSEGITGRTNAVDWLVQSAIKHKLAKVTEAVPVTVKATSAKPKKAKAPKPEGEKAPAKKPAPKKAAVKASPEKEALDKGDEQALAEMLGLAAEAEQKPA